MNTSACDPDCLNDSQPRGEGAPTLMQGSRALQFALEGADRVAARRLGVHRNDLRCMALLEHGALTPGALGRGMGLTSGSVTALLDRLEEAGLVDRRPSTVDRRSVAVTLRATAGLEMSRIYDEIGRLATAHYSRVGAVSAVVLAIALETLAQSLTAAVDALPPVAVGPD